MNKQDFPIFNRIIDGKELVYLDNAATTQKPKQVIDAFGEFYSTYNANIKRGSYTLSDEATDIYENTRIKVAKFINAQSSKEIIFTKNSTEALNIVAQSWGMANLTKDDEILATELEHNSSILPWLQTAKQTGATLKYIPTNINGEIDIKELKSMLSAKTKVIILTHASNVLGTILPIAKIAEIAKEFGTKVVVDGSQGIPGMPINVQQLGCDFYAFSAHKMLGPMGLGFLWGKKEILEQTPPLYQGGGMVKTFDDITNEWQNIPDRFEAGTPDVAAAYAFGKALDYLQNIGMGKIREHEIELTSYTLEKLKTIPNLHILGPLEPTARTGLVSFYIDHIHSHDISAVLSQEGICVRSGLHCAMNVTKKLNIPATTRASFYIYNEKTDVDKMMHALAKAIKILG